LAEVAPLDVVPDEVVPDELVVDPLVELVDDVVPDEVADPVAGAPVVFCGVPVVSDCWFSPAEVVLDPLVVPFAMTSSPSSRVC
jgi:hypothetical protein